MKILTYNVWHGLNAQGIIKMVPFEKPWRIRVRWQAALQALSQAKADIVFLQEVNPLPHKRSELERVLSLKSVGVVDNSGLKINGWGLPINLQSGLCTLVAAPFRIVNSVSLKLSGDRQSVENHSLQFRESRYGLLTTLEHPTWGQGLVINCHLHHGPQWSDGYGEKISQLTTGQKQKVLKKLRQGDERRMREVRGIFNYLEEGPFDWVIWGGDFNADTKSSLYQKILHHGFKDVCKPYDDEMWTWNGHRNKENHKLQEKFCFPLNFKGVGLSEEQERALWRGIKEQGQTVKRIDHLFFKSSLKIKLQGVHLLATNNVKGYGFKPSDHFGLIADVKHPEESE